MRKLLFSFIIFSFTFLLFSEPEYKFYSDKPINYSFQIKGNFSISYPGISEEKFNVSVKGNLKIEMINYENEIYTLKLTPSKTFIKVGNDILEDITNSEIQISSIISQSFIKMKKNGEIVEVVEIKEGLLSLSHILQLLPVFQNNLVSGKKWSQKLPAFNLPGIPLCSLEFTYLYEKKKDISVIHLTSSQNIKEIKKGKDMQISFDGKNNSKGYFNFNEENGEIENFNGDFNVNLNIKFEVPPSPEIKDKKTETVPLKIILILNFQLAKTS